MRIFGGDRMRNLMKTLNVPADMPIENKMISRSIESAQKKVEGNNFDIRKHLVEYDDVINKHRTGIYRRRREILEIAEGVRKNDDPEEKSETEETKESARALSDIILEMVNLEIAHVVNFHTAADNASEWNIKEIAETMRTIWTGADMFASLEETIKSNNPKEALREKMLDLLTAEALKKYQGLDAQFKAANLEFKEVEKGVLIRSIDQMWVEHLETVDYLRRGIGLRGYGQRDPLVEYKKEAYRLYQELNDLISKQVVYSIYKTADALTIAAPMDLKLFAEEPEKKLNFSGAVKEMHKEGSGRNTVDLVHEKVKTESGVKVGRNDPCPCGSGSKYKHCCGK